MLTNTNWIQRIQKLTVRASSILFSSSEFKRELSTLISADDSPLLGIAIRCEFDGKVLLSTGVIGKTTDKEARVLSDRIGKDHNNIDIRIEYWERAPVRSNLLNQFSALLEEVIHPSAREMGHGIINAPYFDVKNRLIPTIHYLRERDSENPIHVVYIDLDHFSELNNGSTHSKADEALRYFAAELEQAAATVGGIALKYAGDEYSMLTSGYKTSEVVAAIETLKTRVAQRPFGDDGFRITFACGILALSDSDYAHEFKDLLDKAELATKVTGSKEKWRNQINFVGDSPLTDNLLDTKDFIKLGIALIRNRAIQISPFENVILNVISAKAFALAQIATGQPLELQELLTWLGVEYDKVYSARHLIGGGGIASSSIPRGAVALAICHGYYRCLSSSQSSAENLSIEFSSEGDAVGIWSSEGIILWGESGSPDDRLSIGTPIDIRIGHGKEPKFLPATVVIQVGLRNELLCVGDLNMPSDLFADIVVVDDRPNSGGGLPDFWQAALTHVAEALCKYPSVTEILVLGNESNASETIGRLRGTIPWDSSEAVDLMRFPRQLVVDRTSLFGSQHVHMIASRKDFIDALYRYHSALTFWTTSSIDDAVPGKSRLSRRIQTDGFQLDLMHGLKCETAADAYPMIIEIMRTADTSFATFDDANQLMYETKGFKLTLDDPYSDTIPGYFINQKDTLKRYVESVLLDPKSKIGQHFYDDGQYEAFIEHLASYCTNEGKETSTRRAILIVKNDVSNGELRPLGLVCVWATPKKHGLTTIIEFCFVWRTVEALVGLPYSLYGSISFAEKIAVDVSAKIRSALATDEAEPEVAAGSLTYLALSLHMRGDEFHRRIAKRIVDGASQ